MGALRCRWVVLLVLCPATALMCLSAPSLPHRSKLSDDELSLANISQVRLDIQPLNRRLPARDVKAQKGVALWTESLADVGIEVVDDGVVLLGKQSASSFERFMFVDISQVALREWLAGSLISSNSQITGFRFSCRKSPLTWRYPSSRKRWT